VTNRQLIAHSADANPILNAMVADDLVRDRD
jgi:hypothetical protein